MAAWDDLYSMTCDLWDRSHDRWADGPDISGIELCDKHDVLSCCWLESYFDAIIHVASKDENRGEKECFLYYMLGVLETSWKDHLHAYYGDFKKEEVNT